MNFVRIIHRNTGDIFTINLEDISYLTESVSQPGVTTIHFKGKQEPITLPIEPTQIFAGVVTIVNFQEVGFKKFPPESPDNA